MKVVVSGGSGLLGSVLQKLEPNWLYPSSIEMNLLNYENTLNYINKNKPDVVVHLAARVGGLYENISNKNQMFEDNIIMNMNILKACESNNVKKFCTTLSTCIFPCEYNLPFTEEMIHNGPPHSTNEGYAHSKRMLEFQCRMSEIPTLCLIPCNLYGPYDNFNLNQAHVIPALIHKCYLAKKNNTPFKILGSGEGLRQFLYNEDLAKIIKWAVEKEINKHEIYVCAPDENEEVSIKHIVEKIAKGFDYNNVVFDVSFTDGQIKKTASNKKLSSITNVSFSNFDEKLEYTIKWFVDNYDSLRK
jgi:GDP-L-fucose synthase